MFLWLLEIYFFFIVVSFGVVDVMIFNLDGYMRGVVLVGEEFV